MAAPWMELPHCEPKTGVYFLKRRISITKEDSVATHYLQFGERQLHNFLTQPTCIITASSVTVMQLRQRQDGVTDSAGRRLVTTLCSRGAKASKTLPNCEDHCTRSGRWTPYLAALVTMVECCKPNKSFETKNTNLLNTSSDRPINRIYPSIKHLN